MKNFNVNDQGFYGRFGGAYVPEILHANVEKLRECYLREMEDESFQQEFRLLLRVMSVVPVRFIMPVG